jgi:lysozyme
MVYEKPTLLLKECSVRISELGVDLIRNFEGFSLDAYRDSGGIWSIGYGSTSDVRPGMRITPDEADKRLRSDVTEAEQAVRELVTVPLEQGEFDALVSFTYNLGRGNLKRSTLLRKLNAGFYKEAAEEFPKWRLAAGKVLQGLVRRRAAEKALFLSADRCQT